jgi:hypothetical protein
MAEDLKELTRKYIDEVWNQGRLDVVDRLVAPDCITHDPDFRFDLGAASATT